MASPTAGLMFTNDTMPVKVRFFFAVGPMDYRGLYKANVGKTAKCTKDTKKTSRSGFSKLLRNSDNATS